MKEGLYSFSLFNKIPTITPELSQNSKKPHEAHLWLISLETGKSVFGAQVEGLTLKTLKASYVVMDGKVGCECADDCWWVCRNFFSLLALF